MRTDWGGGGGVEERENGQARYIFHRSPSLGSLRASVLVIPPPVSVPLV